MADALPDIVKDLIWRAPLLILLLTALILSLVKLSQYPRPATLVLIGTILLFLQVFIEAILYHYVLPQMIEEQGMEIDNIDVLYGVVAFFNATIWAVASTLWLIAAFVGRSDSPRRRPRYDDED